MIETEMQGLIVTAVKEAGGRGLKLNNRFLVGVVDLLVKLPSCRPFWLEAKKIDLSAKTWETANHVWDLDLTKKQKDFLHDWDDAGMLTGVASFVQIKGQGVKGLKLALYRHEDCLVNEWKACCIDHTPLGGPAERLHNIRTLLREFAKD